jgi:hypothetical protein
MVDESALGCLELCLSLSRLCPSVSVCGVVCVCVCLSASASRSQKVSVVREWSSGECGAPFPCALSVVFCCECGIVVCVRCVCVRMFAYHYIIYAL